VGTAATATNIPISFGGGTGTAAWYHPGSSTQQVTLNAEVTVQLPAACKPSLSITSYVGAVMTWNLYSVTPSTGSDIWTANSVVLSVSTGAGAGSSASVTAGSASPAGTILTLTSGTGVAPGGGGFTDIFSCN
jgi:hypothetical protein